MSALAHLVRCTLCIGLTLLLFAFIGACTKAHAAEGYTAGLHLATAHFSNHELQPFTPGVYARVDAGPLRGLTGGAYRNSYGRTSAYAGYTWQTEGRTFAITVGAVTGYPAASVMPLVVPSVRVPLWHSVALRLAYIPRPLKQGTSDAVHASVEQEF